MRGILVSIVLAVLGAGTALAQGRPPNNVGSVTKGTVDGVALSRQEQLSINVLRSGVVYRLNLGDPIFENDVVFTRTNGAVRFTVNNCDVGLGGQREFRVTLPLTCPGGVLGTTEASAGTLLEYSATYAGFPGTVGVGAVGGTPALLAAVLAAGAGTAALTNQGGPASPS